MRKLLPVFLLQAVLVTSASVMAENQSPAEQSEQMQSQTPPSPGANIKELNHAINLWHDATLKGDGPLAARRFIDIETVIRTDISQNQMRVDKYRWQLEVGAKKDNSQEAALDRQKVMAKLSEADSWLKIKRRILSAVLRAEAFSNRYRLLGDYVEIMRRELDKAQKKMAIGDPADPDAVPDEQD